MHDGTIIETNKMMALVWLIQQFSKLRQPLIYHYMAILLFRSCYETISHRYEKIAITEKKKHACVNGKLNVISIFVMRSSAEFLQKVELVKLRQYQFPMRIVHNFAHEMNDNKTSGIEKRLHRTPGWHSNFLAHATRKTEYPNLIKLNVPNGSKNKK